MIHTIHIFMHCYIFMTMYESSVIKHTLSYSLHIINFYISVTKKAKGSAELTMSSLCKEINDGVVFIFGGITDAFVAAQEELVMVLKDIDKKAIAINQMNPGYLKRKSKVAPDLVYDYGGSFRQACLRSCQMHNFERVLLPLLDKVLGKQGLALQDFAGYVQSELLLG